MHDDRKFLNTHPQLIPLPTDIKQRRALLDQHSVLRGEAVRNRLLLDALAGLEGEQALHALHVYYRRAYDLSEANYDRDRQYMLAAMQTAHDAHAKLLGAFLTKRELVHLQMISDVATANNPVDLLRISTRAARQVIRNPHDAISSRIAFEGARLLRMTQLEFEASLYGLSREGLTGSMRSFTSALEDMFFEPKHSERYMVEVDLDPKNAFRVSGKPRVRGRNDPIGSRNNGYERISFPFDVRFVLVRGRSIPVFYDSRVKEALSLKLLRKEERDPRSLHDLCGAKFVFFTQQDLEAAVSALRNAVVRYPGCVFGEASSLERSGVLDAENTSSADEFRAWKFNILFGGRYFELQFMLVGDWVNEWASHGKENHDLYKLRAYLEHLFPRLWPQEIYDIDWTDPGLGQRLHESMLHRIGKDVMGMTVA